ncbi:MAG TPA: metal-dependent transcriptional regulator [Longimicrobiales bacterium]
MPTSAVEDYLKAIYQLSVEGERVSNSAIADRLGIAAASVTDMLKRLGEAGLVEHVPYRGVTLTAAGAETAVRMIRRHRVLESFLVERLGYTWDEVHEEAERLEHAASDELIDRMARVLGEPREDPHGHPIPARGCAFLEEPLPTLAELEEGRQAVLRRVSDDDPAFLRYIAALNLRPGAELELMERAPFDGPLRVRIGEAEQFLGLELARRLHVEPRDEAANGEAEGTAGR